MRKVHGSVLEDHTLEHYLLGSEVNILISQSELFLQVGLSLPLKISDNLTNKYILHHTKVEISVPKLLWHYLTTLNNKLQVIISKLLKHSLELKI